VYSRRANITTAHGMSEGTVRSERSRQNIYQKLLQENKAICEEKTMFHILCLKYLWGFVIISDVDRHVIIRKLLISTDDRNECASPPVWDANP
jgi:hypothetical protein